jgi:hypothetical protein
MENSIRSFTLKEWKYLNSVFNIRSGYENFLAEEINKIVDCDFVYKTDLFFEDKDEEKIFFAKDLSNMTEYDFGCIDEDLTKVYVPKFFWSNFKRYLSIDGFIGHKFKDEYGLDDYNTFQNQNSKIIKFHIDAPPRQEQVPLFEKMEELQKYEMMDQRVLHGIIQAVPGYGKEQAYSEPVLTPTGWTTMGELKLGDYVVDANGNPTKILEIHEQGIKDVYQIDFNDGSSVKCGLDHLWRIYRHEAPKDKKWKVIPLKEFKDNFLGKPYQDKHYENSNQKARKYAVQLCEPIQFEEKKLLINPYAMGLLLGDGLFRLSGNQISYSDKDDSTIYKLVDKLNKFTDLTYKKCGGDWKLYSTLLKDCIKEYKLDNMLLMEKHIPKDYLYSSIDQRRQLLQGLLDTDSWFDKNGQKHFVTSSKQLRDDILELGRGLGYHTSYITRINPKYSQHATYDILINETEDKKFIDNIQKLDYQENSRCIVVDNNDHLYITTDYTVTHNTYSSLKITSNFKLRTVVVVPNEVLSKQWKESILEFGNIKEEDIGFLQGSDPTFLLNEIQKEICIVIINSLYSQIKRLGRDFVYSLYKDVGIVFYDEAHVSGAAESFSKTSGIFKTNIILGLTATPYRKGVNEFLLVNSIGNLIFKSDHQNLIPTIHVHHNDIVFDQKTMDKLNFFRNDYIRFLVMYNAALYDNDGYFNYLADWINYRVSNGYKTIVIFSTNKMIYKLSKVLKFRYKLDSGIIIGDTEKEKKVEKDIFTKEMVDIILEHYFNLYPKKKKLPNIKEGANIKKSDFDLINTLNQYFIDNNIMTKEPMIDYSNTRLDQIPTFTPEIVQIVLPEKEKVFSEMEIAKKKMIVIGNPQMLSAGYDDTMSSCLFVCTPLVGKVVTIQSVGRITRTNPNKKQDVHAHFMWSTVFSKYFPDMHWTLVRNLKTGFPDAKFNLEGFQTK